MDNILSKIILRNWGGINVTADIDEKLKDIKVAVKYSDHGDDFLFVKTKDGNEYEYGWYIDRQDVFCPDYDELIKSPNDYGFIRKPRLIYAYDNKHVLSNEIFLYVKKNFVEDISFGSYRYPYEYDDTYIAQLKLDNYVEFMKDIYGRKITYHKNDDRQEIEYYLKKTGILTQENIDKLNSVRFSSSENEIDGSAGKVKRNVGKVLEGDRVEFVWYNGEFQELNNKQIRHYYDEDYFERFKLYLNQFK